MRPHGEPHRHPVILHVHEAVLPDWDIMSTQMEEELSYPHTPSSNAAATSRLARISIRKVVGGQDFKSRVRKLQRQPKMKSFVPGDTPQHLKREIAHNSYLCLIFSNCALVHRCFQESDFMYQMHHDFQLNTQSCLRVLCRRWKSTTRITSVEWWRVHD